MNKTVIILDLASFGAGVTALYCLLGGAILLAGAFLWTSLMIGGVSMSVEARAIAANRIDPIKGLHDWN